MRDLQNTIRSITTENILMGDKEGQGIATYFKEYY